MSKNYGVIFEPLEEEDYVFGAERIVDNITMDGNWTPYLPKDEVQTKEIRTMACVSFSANSCIETIFNYQIKHGMLSVGALSWLEENGYMENGEVNLSDRFLATISDTTKEGNSGKKVAQAIHEVGCIPESMHPFTEGIFKWNDYYSMPTTEMFDMAYEFNERFLINYEAVYKKDFKEALKHSPLQVYVYAWNGYENGEYVKTDKPINHAVELHKGTWYVFDTYEKLDSFSKKLAEDFIFFNIGYKYKLSEKKPMTNVKVLKDANSNEVGFLLPAINSDAFKSLGANFGIDVPTKEGQTDWSKVKIDGEYELT